MPLTLDSTLSGENAESYISVATADAYHAKRPGYEGWEALGPDDKVRALIGATDKLEQLSYWGEPAVVGQALKFPRIYRTASDGASIPKMFEHAVCELALYVATSDSSAQDRRASLRAQGVTSHRIADFSETFADTGVGAAGGAAGALSELPPKVQRLIGDWVRLDRSSDSGRRAGSQGRRFIPYIGWVQ